MTYYIIVLLLEWGVREANNKKGPGQIPAMILLLDLQTHPVVISPFLECIFWIEALGFWSASHIASWSCEIKAIIMGQGK